MFSGTQKNFKYIPALFAVLLLSSPAAWAGGPPAPSLFSNPLAVILIIIMILLLIVIGILANILIGAADMKLKSRKAINNTVSYSIALLFCLLPVSSIFGQDTMKETPNAAASIGGMSSSVFYLMATVIFLEMALVIALLINIKLLIKKEREKLIVVEDVKAVEAKEMRLSWWDKLNRLRPVSQEAELDLGHEYDGIRELNNKLPPWWLYGFYLSIIFAVVYLWRFHVSHNGPSSKEEYEISVARAELKTKEYLKAKGDAVDENSVTILTATDDISEGKNIFLKSCASCHTETGGGNVGPNLTDDFWLHGNDIKSVFKTIRYGINAMPQWQNAYSNKQLAQVASYVKSLHGSNPPNAKAPQGIEMKEAEKLSPVDSIKTTKSPVETVKQ
ncbi:MAG: cbb3-type cytochrome c oxidase N-terminal domain-containing protein [Bacteroidota bacterium]